MSEKTTKTTAPARSRGPMGGPMGGPGPVEKPKDMSGTLKKLLVYMKQFRLAFVFVVLLSVFAATFSIVGPRVLGMATTALYEGLMGLVMGTGAGIDFGHIGRILLIVLSLYVVSFGFQATQGIVMSRISAKVTFQMRRDIMQKVERLPLKFFDTNSYGDVLSHITNDVDVISQSLNQSMTQIITSATSILGIMIMMITIKWQMALVAFVVLPVSAFIIRLMMGFSQKYFVSQQVSLGQVNGHIEEMFSSHIIVKAFNGEQASIGHFGKYNDELYTSAWKSQFFSSIMQPLMMAIGNIGYVFICILGGYFASQGALPIGDIQSFIQYMRSFMQPIAQVATVSNVLQQTAAASERIFAFLAQEEEAPDPEVAVSTADLAGEVDFAHVSFGYSPDKMIINDFSAVASPGKTIALVGPTGAGKTTIVKLLMRYYDVNEGAVLVDKYNIKQFRRNDLRALFGMVLQDTWLYNATIRENIRYGNLNATDDEVYAAAKAAQADFFIRTLPGGYDMIINEESSNISQGQKQLLTIARALLSNPKILILDEATSSVDTRTEVLIQKAMKVLMEGRTNFIIAHRLSTIKNADLILVMNHGDVVESGSHSALLAQNGFYANLYNAQFDGMQDD